MEQVKAGRAIVDVLRAEGVSTVFGLPGGHVLGIYDALYDTGGIRHVLVRHEHAAASMAAAHAQLTGEPGVCLVTAGPGATNLLTGIAPLVVYLLSDESAFVSGAEIVVDGGQTAHGGAKSISDAMREAAR